MLRSEFRLAVNAFISEHPEDGWSWKEHPMYSNLGFMTREVYHTRRLPTIGVDEEEMAEDDAAVPVMNITETLTCIQSVVYSDTFQVPAFYFTLHDAGGSPLPIEDLMRTTLFRRFAFEGAEHTSFGVNLPGSAFPLLSQGDHPTLGTPSWYFHPCESAASVNEILVELGGAMDGQGRPLLWLEKWMMVVRTVVHM